MLGSYAGAKEGVIVVVKRAFIRDEACIEVGMIQADKKLKDIQMSRGPKELEEWKILDYVTRT